jgi:hypothetical protein
LPLAAAKPFGQVGMDDVQGRLAEHLSVKDCERICESNGGYSSIRFHP